ncbi:MAG: hypothetical protein KBT06_11045 [Prevotellaceae bacterium]|nr:hypothetical protein [Candidatus Colivivens equi]
MKAKDYLKQVKQYQIMIDQLTTEIADLRIMAIGSGSNGISADKVQSSPAIEDKMAAGVAKYVDLENELLNKRWEYAKLRCKVLNEIHELTDSRFIQILYLHYVLGKRLEEIACIMRKSNGEPYSYDHINALHGEALIAFQEVLDERNI